MKQDYIKNELGMSRLKNWLALLGGMLLIASLLAGCGGGDKKPAPAAENKPAATAPAPAKEVQVESPIKGKIGRVAFSSQKIAGGGFEGEAYKLGSMAKYKGDLLYSNAEQNTVTALKLDGAKAGLDKSLFTNGVYAGDSNFHMGNLSADNQGNLYITTNFSFLLKDNKLERIDTHLNGFFQISPDGKNGYEASHLNFSHYTMTGTKTKDAGKIAHPFKFIIYSLAIDQDGKLYVLGATANPPDSKHRLAVFSAAGEQLGVYGSDDKKAPEYLNISRANLALTDKYVVVADTMNDTSLWTKDGQFVGKINNSKLYGKGYDAQEIVGWTGNSVMVGAMKHLADKKYDYQFFQVTF